MAADDLVANGGLFPLKGTIQLHVGGAFPCSWMANRYGFASLPKTIVFPPVTVAEADTDPTDTGVGDGEGEGGGLAGTEHPTNVQRKLSSLSNDTTPFVVPSSTLPSRSTVGVDAVTPNPSGSEMSET
jgi:hypothetical protein